MLWYLIIGGGFTGWTLLLILSGERMRRVYDAETTRRNAEIAAETQRQKAAQIPLVR
jgi:hypothetical protein